MSSSIPGMYPNTRLIYSGEYGSLFIDEPQELKDLIYEMVLENFVKTGEIHLLPSQPYIDTEKMIKYLRKEFMYTGVYTKYNHDAIQAINERNISKSQREL